MVIAQNRSLSIAFAASALVHIALLAVRFVAPDTFQFKPADPGLEVILVNAKHDRAPVKAEALAQANLDGGGQADAGRSRSPLPDMGKTENGDGLKAIQRRIEELEQQQRMLAQANKKSPLHAAPVKDAVKPQAQPADGTDAMESARAILRREAEISKRMDDENKRPKKTFISPSTREVGYAMYFNRVRERIENIGTLNFPQKDGRKLYGELTLSIAIFQDGQIYAHERDDGIAVERSSGNPALDEAARRIVRRAAPFGAFAKNMRSSDRDDVWIMTTRFKFTREDALEAEMQGRAN
ncbi:TonB C-terminal domain-containing protein [Noviherbaspirillum galbum]|uniref:TonB C-terminal domain-containing protein n=1 Tax=Noviherbaspirillum galbum TaxID=2709383 RepID=A0A6B3SVB3_9BURK|nr:TonB C-terminal domain-containing protein [Noviherbaspirillum galbum]NEX64451.1 TonB C-terminal domain-containing protein [Noviherbaspirillum galbum]